MPRDSGCMYITHVCLYVGCSDCMGVCDNVCCIAAVVKDNVFILRVLKYVVCLCKGLLTCVTCGCSAASNWKPGPHAVSTIVKCLQSPGCC